MNLKKASEIDLIVELLKVNPLIGIYVCDVWNVEFYPHRKLRFEVQNLHDHPVEILRLSEAGFRDFLRSVGERLEINSI